MFYPLMVNLKEKKVVVVGGGKVAFRKVKKLLEFETCVVVVSESIIPQLRELKNDYKNKLYFINKSYDKKYILDAFVVIAATSCRNINGEIACVCSENNILCNVVDSIDESNFIMPSVVKRGSLVISVSTMGKSPSLCGKIKKDLEASYTGEYEEYVELLGKVRDLVLLKYKDEEYKKKILNNIVNLNLIQLGEFYNKLMNK